MQRVFRCLVICRPFVKGNVASVRFSTSVTYRDVSPDSCFKPDYQPISNFYAGKSVFITGATGFIGRLMIERLLFTCKDIEKVYVLIREKKNASIHQRLEEILSNPIFTKLKHTRPQDLRKVVPIAGDIADPELGIKCDDEQTLIDKVSVVFHSAAQVKFTVPTSEHLRINYEGTKKVLELGKKIKNLDVFVHVSTAFSNSYNVIEEMPYPPPKEIDDVYRIIKTNDPKEIRKLLDFHGNSYTFSKKMVEAYVVNNHGNMPTIIVRPSMVTSVYKEPLTGHTDSWVAVTTLLCDVSRGLTRVLYGDKHVVVDIIPVDYVCNFLIIAAARSSGTHKCNVYNIATSHMNPIRWDKLSDLYIKEGNKNNSAIIPFPAVYFTQAKWMIPILRFAQIIPTYIADAWLRFLGKEPRYTKLVKSAIARSNFGTPVTNTSWLIKTARAQELISTLDDKDKTTYPCDPTTIDWDKYVPIYSKGVKDYMLDKK
ncbi:putative fatty acyl-CoA reductase CG5065 [Epargyreus clarus]|uniref:putative fatty acyl-CoA reductase CG5065 n=1 Tax=Epargyreus clarus TaxID=520877 RepID=UPI003C2C1E97